MYADVSFRAARERRKNANMEEVIEKKGHEKVTMKKVIGIFGKKMTE